MRIDRDLTQKQVAAVLNIRQNTYAKYEIGTLNYRIDVVLKLADYYETSVDYLMGRTDDPAPYSWRHRPACHKMAAP